MCPRNFRKRGVNTKMAWKLLIFENSRTEGIAKHLMNMKGREVVHAKYMIYRCTPGT